MSKYQERPVLAPTEKAGSITPDGVTLEHPAFGQIAASRVSGGTALYGSNFRHQHYVTITIRRSSLQRDLSRDWATAGDELIEVALSEAQWATFVSSMNVGMGVQCTLTWLRGEGYLPFIPLRQETDVVKAELDATMVKVAELVAGAIRDIEGELGQSVSGKKREAILERMRLAERQLSDHLPFAAKSFGEHMEAVVEKAKIEVNAHVESMIHRAGLAALTGGQPETPLLQLEPGDDHD